MRTWPAEGHVGKEQLLQVLGGAHFPEKERKPKGKRLL